MLIHRVLGFSLCVFIVSVLPAGAADGPTAGVVVGANIASVGLKGSDATGINVGKKAGLFVGGFALWPITQMIAIQPEVAYSAKYFSVNDTISGFSADEKWDWVEVPILARVAFWRKSDHTLYVVGGPGFGFRARVREKTGGQTSDIKDDVQDVDVSIIGGGGFTVGKIGVEVRYDGGVRDLNKDHNLGDNLTVKSRAVRANLMWSFK